MRRLTINDVLSRTTHNANGCMLWNGFVNIGGYGRVSFCGKTWATHRLVYAHLKGELKDGLVIDHLCRNRRCVNPDHLDQVTPFVNNVRGASPTALNLFKNHCPRGHSLGGANLYTRPSGYRECLMCKKANAVKHRPKENKRKRDRRATLRSLVAASPKAERPAHKGESDEQS